ncbi:hypothetical protein PsAD14_05712 [Pseudovibrio sp. Ad14]|nr:hypothetical protein PsW74_05452 [Pseudovibrio sp. W74]KZL03182.1 hypothetical protein PsAD14_05712 [Pseudovibrio sp. Ad14]KZL15871.1 hypothetical protein PsAD37_04245 [Pseudovibrio sp. Ad37]
MKARFVLEASRIGKVEVCFELTSVIFIAAVFRFFFG